MSFVRQFDACVPSVDTADAGADAQVDRVVDWLLGSLEWNATLFHVGQYCGRWRASTAGRARASFHLILEGRCWLHMPGRASVQLSPRDGVFLMRDVPHFLSPYADPGIDCAPRQMQPLSGSAASAKPAWPVASFSFDGPFRDVIASAFPDCLVLRAGDLAMASAGTLFDLMRSEALRVGAEPSVAMDRLAGLLFFYGLRHVAHSEVHAQGLWTLLRKRGFAPLLADILQSPARDWSVAEMARRVNLSRTAFFRQFGEACDQSPLQFLLLLRMQLAARRMAQGDSISQAAEAVGYASYAAFSRAFKRVMGEQPGAWQRARSGAPSGPVAPHGDEPA
ncbi:AraC family transcriptional regulator [Variovorax sp. KBS0712]|uniref:AraC family transcriptional regulator n=1 Tax=Variovorax sp. KBS0712 TaxID=2578111 RepID=UPI00117CCE6C|nr:AraC family transcriptional regulator [Variovorax sp. KBS0712]TSD60078.1 AraC family transcriptional regulator [Variovorax sp. KBS0712]